MPYIPMSWFRNYEINEIKVFDLFLQASDVKSEDTEDKITKVLEELGEDIILQKYKDGELIVR